MTEWCICCSTKKDFAESPLTIRKYHLAWLFSGVLHGANLWNIIKNLKRIEWRKDQATVSSVYFRYRGDEELWQWVSGYIQIPDKSAGQVILSKTETNLSTEERKAYNKWSKKYWFQSSYWQTLYGISFEWWNEISTYLDGSCKIEENPMT